MMNKGIFRAMFLAATLIFTACASSYRAEEGGIGGTGNTEQCDSSNDPNNSACEEEARF
ncbi:MAG: hypothetical protein AAF387_22675 [Pseudomonadota bacterium]